MPATCDGPIVGIGPLSRGRHERPCQPAGWQGIVANTYFARCLLTPFNAAPTMDIGNRSGRWHRWRCGPLLLQVIVIAPGARAAADIHGHEGALCATGKLPHRRLKMRRLVAHRLRKVFSMLHRCPMFLHPDASIDLAAAPHPWVILRHTG